ncbi:MAG: DUF72 domain-containing protein [Phycisphaerales bacterium]
MNRQLGLFGDDEPAGSATEHGRGRGRTPPIRTTPSAAALRDLADHVPARVHLGTSSWSFPGWRGLVWSEEDPPPTKARLARDGLAAYAAHPLLRGVGVDRTFYAPVPVETYAAWAKVVPEDFRFLVKTPRRLVEPRDRDGRANPDFLNAAACEDELIQPAREGLGDRLGTVLVQFPPMRFRRTDDARRFIGRLHGFVSAFRQPNGPPIAVEVRDAVLVDDELVSDYTAAVHEAGAAHTYVAHPLMPSVAEQVERIDASAANHVVCRWMLRAGFSYEDAREVFSPFDRMVAPDVPTRRAVAALCRAAVAGGQEVMVIANNKAEGSAPRTLARLAAELTGVPGSDTGIAPESTATDDIDRDGRAAD